MVEIELDSSGLNAFVGKFAANLKDTIQLSLRQSAEKVTNRAKDTKYVPFWHGTLRSSITFQVETDRATVGTDLVYAPVQEFGATIKAKNAKFLRFKTRDGKWHMVKQVTIPPYKGRGYLRPALADSMGDIKSIFEKNLANQLK